jgi:hypothetical protein
MPHRYYDTATITFLDGTTEKVGGNREEVRDGVLTIWTTNSYGDNRDRVQFPLSAIKSWRWEKE